MTVITPLNVRLGMDASNFSQGIDLARREVNRVASIMRQSEPAASKYQREIELLNKVFSDAGRQSAEYAAAVDFLAKRHQQGQYSAEAVAKAQQAKAAAEAAAAAQSKAAAAQVAEQRRLQAAEEARLNKLAAEGEAVTRSLYTAEQRHAATLRQLNELLRTQSIGQETYARAVRRANAELTAANPAVQRQNQLLAEGRQLTQSLLSPMERHSASMSRLRELYRSGAIDSATYHRAVRNADQQLKQHTTTVSTASAQTSRLAASVRAAAAAYLSIQGIRSGLSLASNAEQAAIAFEVMTGSAEAGRKVLGELASFAARTPISLSGAQSAAQTLIAFGLANERVIPTVRMLGDVSAGNEQRFQSLALAFGQMSSVGRLMGQDLLQMTNAGFNPLQEISRTTGQSIEELKKQMEAGAISVEMVTAAFESATGPGGRFHGLMDRMGDTAAGAYAQLVSSVQSLVASVGSQLLPMLARAARSIETLVQSTVGLAGGMSKSEAQVAATVVAFGSAVIVIPKVVSAIASVTAAIKAMTAAKITSLAFTGPKGWAIIAASAAVAAVAVRQVSKAYDDVAESAKNANDKAGGSKVAAAAKASASAIAASVSPLEAEFLKMEHSLNEQVKLLNLGEAAYRRQQMYAKGMSIAQVQRIEQLHQEIALAEERNRKQKEAAEQRKREIERVKQEAEDAFTRNISSALQAARKVFDERRKADELARRSISEGPASAEVGSGEAAKYMADRVNQAISAAAVPERPTPGESEILKEAAKQFAEAQKQTAIQDRQEKALGAMLAQLKENGFRRIR